MAKAPRLDRLRKSAIGTIHPPVRVGVGMATFEQDHHYFDVHGVYLGSHEGYEPGHDVGAPADAIIATMRDMSDEAKAKIAAALGLAPAQQPAKPSRGRKPAAAEPVIPPAPPEGDAGDGDESGETDGDDGQTSDEARAALGLAPRGPLAAPDPAAAERIGGLDLVGWAQGKVNYPFFQVKKAYSDAFPGTANGDQKAILDGLVAAGVIEQDEVNRG